MLRFFLSLKKKYALSKEICHYEKKKKINMIHSKIKTINLEKKNPKCKEQF